MAAIIGGIQIAADAFLAYESLSALVSGIAAVEVGGAAENLLAATTIAQLGRQAFNKTSKLVGNLSENPEDTLDGPYWQGGEGGTRQGTDWHMNTPAGKRLRGDMSDDTPETRDQTDPRPPKTQKNLRGSEDGSQDVQMAREGGVGGSVSVGDGTSSSGYWSSYLGHNVFPQGTVLTKTFRQVRRISWQSVGGDGFGVIEKNELDLTALGEYQRWFTIPLDNIKIYVTSSDFQVLNAMGAVAYSPKNVKMNISGVRYNTKEVATPNESHVTSTPPWGIFVDNQGYFQSPSPYTLVDNQYSSSAWNAETGDPYAILDLAALRKRISLESVAEVQNTTAKKFIDPMTIGPVKLLQPNETVELNFPIQRGWQQIMTSAGVMANQLFPVWPSGNEVEVDTVAGKDSLGNNVPKTNAQFTRSPCVALFAATMNQGEFITTTYYEAILTFEITMDIKLYGKPLGQGQNFFANGSYGCTTPYELHNEVVNRPSNMVTGYKDGTPFNVNGPIDSNIGITTPGLSRPMF